VIVADVLRTYRENPGGDPSKHARQTAPELSRWCTVRRRLSKVPPASLPIGRFINSKIRVERIDHLLNQDLVETTPGQGNDTS